MQLTPPRSRVARGVLRLSLMLVAPLAFACSSESDETPPSPLEVEIQELRRSARRPAQDVAELRSRLDTLWRWANDRALSGRVIPRDLPRLARQSAIALDGIGGDETPDDAEAAGAFIDRALVELGALDDDSGAVGSADLTPKGPFRVGERVTLQQMLTVGSRGIAVGGGVVLPAEGIARLQSADSSAPNYVAAATSNPRATLEPAEDWGEWQSWMGAATLAFRLGGEALTAGESVTLTYGGSARGPGGLELPLRASDLESLPLYVDVSGDGAVWTVPTAGFAIIGGTQVAFLSVVAPSVVAVGEPFDVALRSEDATRNLVSGPAPRYRVSLDGETVGHVPAGATGLVILEDLRIDNEGIYRFEARQVGGELAATSNPVLARPGGAGRVLWGDAHGHSGLGSGRGSADAFYRYARDTARLDWAALTEADTFIDDGDWATIQAAARNFKATGRFTTLLGYEWAAGQPEGGHHVVLLGPPGTDRSPSQTTLTQTDLYAALGAAQLGTSLAIPLAHQAVDWSIFDPESVRLVEIHSAHGTFEPFGRGYLNSGAEVGFLASSATAAAHPGYSFDGGVQPGGLTAVVANSNSAATILEALGARTTYATTGERIVIQAQLNGAPMGSRLTSGDDLVLAGSVHGTTAIDTVELMVADGVVASERYLNARVRDSIRVQLRLESEAFGSEPLNPRPARPWRGIIELRGAELAGLELPSLHDPRGFRAEILEGEPPRIEVMATTRGRGVALLLELAGASRSTEVSFQWDEAAETIPDDGTTRETLARDPVLLPAGAVAFRLGDLSAGIARRTLPVPGGTDAIQLQLVPENAALDQDFEFELGSPDDAAGYYYLRVTQVDGAMAWTSPWWSAGPALAGI
ncbi:MAG: DUF3604 domain-containing protein [Acidobacteriota bacterium]|nr:DUF3604 domain-containing protein [Acidobacteriota bacterium]